MFRTCKNQRGSALFLAFFAVLVISGYILVNINVDRDRILEERVTQTAWLIRQVSEGARLYVRDQNAAGTAVFSTASLCTTPRTITVNDLVNNGYLTADIGEKNITGTNFVTPLDQTMRIIAANSSIDNSACAPSQLKNIAAAAYVILEPPAMGIDNLTLSALSQALANFDMPVGSPVFDAGGVNISDSCGVTPATLQWDTGCLDAAQYSFLSGGLPFATFTMGVPTWLTFRGDNRAVFRYAQPENPQANQMQNDLLMANINDIDPATCTQLQHTVPDGTDPLATRLVNSGVCSVVDDSGASGDSRKNIANVNSITSNRVIVAPQATDYVGTIPVPDSIPQALQAGSNVTINGDARGYNRSLAANMESLNFTGASSSMSILSPDLVTPTNVTIGDDLIAGNVQTDTMTANATSVSGQVSALNVFSVSDGAVQLDNDQGQSGLVVAQLVGSSPSVNVDNNAVFGGSLVVNGQTTVNGSGSSLPVAAVRMDAQNTSVDGNLNVGKSLSTIGATSTSISSIGKCLGVCPERSPVPRPPL